MYVYIHSLLRSKVKFEEELHRLGPPEFKTRFKDPFLSTLVLSCTIKSVSPKYNKYIYTQAEWLSESELLITELPKQQRNNI